MDPDLSVALKMTICNLSFIMTRTVDAAKEMLAEVALNGGGGDGIGARGTRTLLSASCHEEDLDQDRPLMCHCSTIVGTRPFNVNVDIDLTYIASVLLRLLDKMGATMKGNGQPWTGVFICLCCFSGKRLRYTWVESVRQSTSLFYWSVLHNSLICVAQMYHFPRRMGMVSLASK